MNMSLKQLLHNRTSRAESCPNCGQKSFGKQYSLGGGWAARSRCRRGKIRGAHYYCPKCHYSETRYEDGLVIKRTNRLETENSHATYMAVIQLEQKQT